MQTRLNRKSKRKENRTRLPFNRRRTTRSYDLDTDPMTLMYEAGVNVLKSISVPKNKVSRSKPSRDTQTDTAITQTDSTERVTAATFVVQMWPYFFAAVFCESLMSYNSAVTSSNSSEIPTTPNGYPYMTAAIYWCLDGRKFDDGTTVRTLNCVGNGHWSYLSVHCDCTYVI